MRCFQAALGFATVLLPSALAGETQLKSFMDDMKSMVHDLRDAVEAAYEIGNRCDRTKNSCTAKSFHECYSEFTTSTCAEPDSFFNEQAAICSAAGVCSTIVSWEHSVVVVPDVLVDESTLQVKSDVTTEMICLGLDVEQHMKETANELMSNKKFGEITPSSFFGSVDGTFRMYPGRAFDECGTFDTRTRPWYVAASSGPKDVVLIMDISGSMDNGYPKKRIDLAKEAAKQIIQRLTIGDFFTVITYSTGATNLVNSAFGNKSMIRATAENIATIVQEIDNIQHMGGTNTVAAFEEAYQALQTASTNEYTSNCNTAVLFLTDGEMDDCSAGSAPPGCTEDGLLEQLRSAVTDLTDQHASTIFTYSLGESADTSLVKEIACQSGGLWSAIPDDGDLAAYMSSYYKMFAMGMGDNSNEDFAAWVEPYEYLTGVKGTTIGSAVFDRSVVPHVFLGVVGVDFTIEEMQSIGGSSYEDVLSALVGRSNAVCPSIDKSTCILEALREESGWENSCPNQPQCAEKVNVVAQKCTGVGDYPNILWDNYNAQGEAFVDRVCCNFDASGGNRGENPGRLSQGQCGVLGELPMSVVIGGAALIVLVIVIRQWKKSAASKVHASPAAPAPAAPAAPASVQQMIQQLIQQVQVQQPQMMAPVAAPVYQQQQQMQMMQPMQQQMQQPMYGQQMQQPMYGQQMQGQQMQQPMMPQMAVAVPMK